MRTKSEARRQAIIGVADALFCEQGFEQASMSQIAARLGGSKATLYNYFPSKEELFVAVIRAGVERDLRTAFTLLRQEDDLGEVLRSFGNNYMQVILGPKVIAMRRMVMQAAERSSVGRLLYESGPKAGWSTVADFLAGCIAAGHLREGDAWVTAKHLRALYEAEFLERRMLNVLNEVTAEELAGAIDRAVAVFMRAYGPV